MVMSSASRPRVMPRLQTSQTRGAARQPHPKNKSQRTFQRRETTIQDEFQIAQLPLAQDNGLQLLCLVVELLAPRRITRNQVLEDTACVVSVAVLPCLRNCAVGLPWGGFAMLVDVEMYEATLF